MSSRFNSGWLLSLTGLALAATLGGCVAHPADGSNAAYQRGGYVSVGGGLSR